MTTFEEVENEAWGSNGISHFVGFGYIEIRVARSAKTANLPYLQFWLKGKRISRDEARRHIEKSWDDHLRVRALKDPAAARLEKLAEYLCVSYSKADPSDDGLGKAWPFATFTEREQWRAVARAALNEVKP